LEYLVSMTTHVPDGTPDEAVQDIRAREAAHSRELAAQGHLLRLWRTPLQPGEWRTLGLLPPPTATGSRRSSPRCRCGCGQRFLAISPGHRRAMTSFWHCRLDLRVLLGEPLREPSRLAAASAS